MKEVEIQQSLKHGNIIEIVDFSYDSDSGNFYILFEKAETDLEKIYKNVNKMQRRSYFGRVNESANLQLKQLWLVYQITSGLKFIHGQGVSHRDLKMGNILLMPTGELKLTDFGISHNEGNKLIS